MFSGIVEAQSVLIALKPSPQSIKLTLQRPSTFDDIKTGDSIAVNGVCLTVEEFNADEMQFTAGPETLRITTWDTRLQAGQKMNLERSLKYSDRVHGHIVLGHVDATGVVTSAQKQGDALELWIQAPASFQAYVWEKGSVALQGVSLTVNKTEGDRFQVVLIPETLKRTNLAVLEKDHVVNLEADPTARGIVHFLSRQRAEENRGSHELNS